MAEGNGSREGDVLDVLMMYYKRDLLLFWLCLSRSTEGLRLRVNRTKCVEIDNICYRNSQELN